MISSLLLVLLPFSGCSRLYPIEIRTFFKNIIVILLDYFLIRKRSILGPICTLTVFHFFEVGTLSVLVDPLKFKYDRISTVVE